MRVRGKLITILSLAVLVTACSEGGFQNGDDTDDSGSDNGDVDTGGGDEAVTIGVGNGTGSDFQPGVLDIDATSLSAGGSTEVSLSIVNTSSNNALYVGDTATVTFTSTCASESTPRASFSPAEASGQGTVSTTYTAEGCTGTDVITASVVVAGTEETAAGTVSIASIEVGTIESIQPEPSTIAIKGFGTDSLPSTTRVAFVVRNKQGNAVSNQEVRFSIPDDFSGIELTKTSGTTNSDGQVTAIAQGGTVNSVFRIVAETDVLNDSGDVTGTISTQSKPISVNTGLPNSSGFGVATTTFNPWAWDRINTEVDITVTASDFHNGPVPDGTVVSFVTSGGQIQSSGGEVSSCEIVEGDCSVKWESGPPYPSTGGTVVLAHVIGEDAFIDENGNSQYDVGESFTALPEPYLDANQNSAYDVGEFFLDKNQDGVWTDVAVGQSYRGASCSDAAVADGHCAEMAYLFATVPMIMSSAVVQFSPDPVPTVDVSSGPQTVFIEMMDINGNAPAIETGVSFSCLGDTEIKGSKPNAMPNVYILGAGFTWGVTLTSPDDPADGNNADGESDICFMDVDTVDGGYQNHRIDVIY